MDQISPGSNVLYNGGWSSHQSINNGRTNNSKTALSSSLNGYNNSQQHVATPLDSLLKHLKKTYAASAGPKDVLGAISKEGMDMWLKNDDEECNDLDNYLFQEGTSGEKEGVIKRSSVIGVTDNYAHAASGRAMSGYDQQQYDVSQFLHHQQMKSSSLIDVHLPPIKPTKRQERRMPDFCRAPSTHVDRLLQTTPHLRHLSNAPTDIIGLGMSESKNIFRKLIDATTQTNILLDSSLEKIDYASSLLRQNSNHRASLELASFLRTLSNEMPHDRFITVESEVYSKLFSLVHSKTDHAERLAGVAALDALLEVPSFDQDKKTIRFGNNLSNGLKAITSDYEFLHAVARALGKMASSAANVDRVEFEIGRSLEWLRSDRGDHRRLAAVLVLCELAREAPTAFYSKTQQAKPVDGVKDSGLLAGLGDLGLRGTNEFLDNIFPVLRDRQLIVRVCAADALSECIKILMERQASSMTALLCNLFSETMQGLICFQSDRSNSLDTSLNFHNEKHVFNDTAAAINAHGSLLAVGTFLDHTGSFIMPRFDEVCKAVLKFMHHPFALLRLEVVRLIPRLAKRCSGTYAMRYLGHSLNFLIRSAKTVSPQKDIDLRPTAFASIGLLYLAMRNEEMPQVTIMDIDMESTILGSQDRNQCYHLIELKDSSDLHSKMHDIFILISENLRRSSLSNTVLVGARLEILGCFANMVEALGEKSSPYVPQIIEDLFNSSGLSVNLIECLRSIAKSLPSKQVYIERRLLNEISYCLTGTKSLEIISNLFSGNDINARPCLKFIKESSMTIHSTLAPTPSPTINKGFISSISLSSMKPVLRHKKAMQQEQLHYDIDSLPPRADNRIYESTVAINTSDEPRAVRRLVLSLRTLRTIGTSYLLANEVNGDNNMLLPFLNQVIAKYLAHPTSDVRQEAAITCLKLLIPLKHHKPTNLGKNDKALLLFELSTYSASIMEEVLQKLMRTATSDLSPVVRLCVIRGLDERYYPYISQQNLLSSLFLMLEDEALAVRACTLQLVGRLVRFNPAWILPVLRKLLIGLITELSCGAGDSVGRETATRLIVVFLREESLHRLVLPVVSSIIDSLPLSNVAPRLVSISLEALGELASVTHSSINPRLQQLIPHIMSNMLDQNSSKQCIGLSAMGKIAFGTGYVIKPYLDYPHLLPQASEILPTTKRAPWELRREVFRLFGTLGAIDPDRLGSSAYKARGLGGRIGGGYFVDFEDDVEYTPSKQQTLALSSSPKRVTNHLSQSPCVLVTRNILSSIPEFRASTADINKLSSDGSTFKNSDNDEPAHLYMYGQYAMTSQPLSTIPSRRRLIPSDDDFYPTVAIAALMRILKNQSLSNLHAMVMKAVMFIFNALGIQSVPFLKQIVPHIIATIKCSDQPGIREALLQQLTNLSSIVREHLRPYLTQIFDVVEEFWFTRHLSSLCTLVERIASAVPDDVKGFVPLLVRLILASIEDIDTSEWSNASDTSQEIDRLMTLLKFTRQCARHDFYHLLIPALVRLTDALVNPEPDGKKRKIHISPLNNTSRSSIAVETIATISHLLQSMQNTSGSFGDNNVVKSSTLPSRVVQPFLRMLSGKTIPNKAVGTEIVECICICIRQLGSGRWMSFYHLTARDTINSWQSKVGIERATFISEDGEGNREDTTRTNLPTPVDIYDEVVTIMASNEEDGSRSEFSLERSRASDASLAGTIDGIRSKDTTTPPLIQSITPATATQWSINMEKLHISWDVSQKTSREDYDEWMRRFSIQLLQEAPSPALRACAELAASYQPLARELFCAAFVCCWVELNEHSRTNLVDSLQHVFASDASLEILQLLLNLAEFMEHDVNIKGAKGGLPIEINLLAELAIKCRAYSKALHYKELEYSRERSGSCVEYLIDINKKLDLPEAALGVLKTARIELENQGAQSVVLTQNHVRTNSRDLKSLAYSVLSTSSEANKKDQNSWAGNVMYESWLTKLGSWAEALNMYETKLVENPSDVNSILGCMHCYDARGDWQRALNLAEMSWGAISDEQQFALEHTQLTHSNVLENRQRALKLCAQASWRLGRWDLLESYTSQLVEGYEDHSKLHSAKSRVNNETDIDFDSYFYRSVLHVHRAEWDKAAKSIDSARKAMDSRFTALLSESYKRAYPTMVSAQTLSELEEIVNFRQFEARTLQSAHLHSANRPDETEARAHLLDVWRSRLQGCRVDAEVHSSILAIRSLVIGPTDEVDATISLAALSRQAEAFRLAERTLLDPLEKMSCNLNGGQVFGFEAPTTLQLGFISTQGSRLEFIVKGEKTVRQPYDKAHISYYNHLVQEAGGSDRLFAQHKLYFAYIKHLWAMDRRDEVIHRLGLLCNVVDLSAHCGSQRTEIHELCVRCWLKYGQCKLRSNPPGEPLSDTLAVDVILSYKRATESLANDYIAWHSWALINFRLAEQIHGEKDQNSKGNAESLRLQNHVVAAVKAFVLAISMGTKRWSASVQQDMLNLLSCLFKYGELHDVARTINEGLVSIKIEAWLGVLPQLLARIHIKSKSIRSVLHPLLVRLGAKHPQALMYPLSVLLKSPVLERKTAAETLINSLKAHSNDLVEEARMVSSELIRVAILWLELWHEGLEDASRLYYGEGNVSGMLDVLLPLHQQLEKGASTRREQDFLKSFGRDLSEAHSHIKEYVRLITRSGQSIPVRGGFLSDGNSVSRSTIPANVEAEAALNQAWDLYYTVFRRINKQLPGMTTLELDQCSPNLFNAKNLELSVPGTYNIDGSYVKIERFITNVQVITSKQRPRKIIIRGDNGNDYVFLLKGHEDLRQDERVMQLFGLVNALLARDGRTNKHELNIQRYAIAPLSHNAGVVGWVPHCDTLHCLIRDYREGKKIPLNEENRQMMALAPNYDSLTSMQKVEIFTEALSRTNGQGNDLYEVLWRKSTNSEEWLERRTNFTRSLAVMSMVGYILGLGDRHPSNLMLDQISGRVLHIDFGDCFEVAMHREKFPEKVPFRLTRMLTKAMEVSGIEGSYRSTCEKTMSVLRDNKGSLVDMLQAFVHDPLISWRLLNQSSGELLDETKSTASSAEAHQSERNTLQTLSLHNASVPATFIPEPIHEGQEEEEEDEQDGIEETQESKEHQDHDAERTEPPEPPVPLSVEPSESTQHAKSLKMFSEMKALAANLTTSSRIQSLTGSTVDPTTRSFRSVRARELLSFVDGEGGACNEETLNEKALKVIRRVQDKLSGTDFNPTGDLTDSLDVPEQVQRLIVQATSSENLCQLFIGWCAFW